MGLIKAYAEAVGSGGRIRSPSLEMRTKNIVNSKWADYAWWSHTFQEEREYSFLPSFDHASVCPSICPNHPCPSIHPSYKLDIGYAPGSVLGIGDTVASRRRQSLPSQSFPSAGHG